MRSRRSPFGRLCLGAVLWCAAVGALGATTLYKWVDANGVTHYSDRPEPGAQRVTVAAAQTYKGQSAAAAEPRARQGRPAEQVSYTRLEVSSPEDGAVLWNTGSRIDVAAAIEPDLANGNQLWFILDGKSQPAAPGGTATSRSRAARTRWRRA
jgi:hypothetical protein